MKYISFLFLLSTLPCLHTAENHYYSQPSDSPRSSSSFKNVISYLKAAHDVINQPLEITSSQEDCINTGIKTAGCILSTCCLCYCAPKLCVGYSINSSNYICQCGDMCVQGTSTCIAAAGVIASANTFNKAVEQRQLFLSTIRRE